MKKKLPSVVLLGSTIFATAQIFSSGFENNNGTPLSSYKKINADGNSVPFWAPVPEFSTEAWIQFYDGFDNKVAFSTSSYDPAGTSDDWLITPAITLPETGQPTAYWKAKSYDEFYADGYQLLISTTDDDPQHFTPLFNIDAEQAYDYAEHSLDLSAYKGQTVYLAFRNNTTDGYFLALDDFYISNSANCKMPTMDGLAVSNLSQNSFKVQWQPTAGVSKYDVGLTDFNTPVSSTGIQSGSEKSFANLTAGKRYQLFLKNADCGSGWAGPKSVFTAALPPYTYGFETTAENYGEYDSDGWTSDTWLNGESPSAANTGDGYAYNNTSKTYAKNDWIYSYPIWLEAGEGVAVSGYARMGSDTASPAALKLSVASAPSASNNIADLDLIKVIGATYNKFSSSWTAPAAGVYYFGFGNVSDPVEVTSALRIDDISITKTDALATMENGRNKIKLYPNPVTDFAYLESDSKITKVQVYSQDGRLIKEQVGSSSKIDLRNVSKGLYIINIITERGSHSSKIIKQ